MPHILQYFQNYIEAPVQSKCATTPQCLGPTMLYNIQAHRKEKPKLNRNAKTTCYNNLIAETEMTIRHCMRIQNYLKKELHYRNLSHAKYCTVSPVKWPSKWIAKFEAESTDEVTPEMLPRCTSTNPAT